LRPVYTTLMSAGILFVVWQGGEQVVSGAMTTGAFIAYLELYLRFINRGFRVPQMVNSMHGGAVLAPLAGLSPGRSRGGAGPWPYSRAGHPRRTEHRQRAVRPHLS